MPLNDCPSSPVSIYVQYDGEVVRRLDLISQQQEQIMLDLTELTAQVAATADVVESAKTVLSELVAELRAAAGNQDAVNALADDLEAKLDDLSAAVAESDIVTPPDPPPAP